MRRRPLLEVARVGAAEIAQELGGLSAPKRHAAELAADALHRALGGAARARAALAPRRGRSLVAMSGGVDSAVAALLVAREGAEAVAVTLELWADPENDGERSCCSAQAVRGARELAHGMGMAHLSIDLRAEFRAGVVDGWLADHAAGLTPNPCVRCNGRVRLDAMLELAERLGCEPLATGHYARVHEAPAAQPGPESEEPLLRIAADAHKDQSYVLAALARSRWPGCAFRSATCTRAAFASWPPRRGCPSPTGATPRTCASSPEPAARPSWPATADGAPAPGQILDRRGRRLGRHRGHEGYTVGQRRGLGVGGGEPLYVLATDARANTVTVGPREELATRVVALSDVTLHCPADAVDHVKLRYRAPAVGGRIETALPAGSHTALDVRLDESIAGAAPGQLASLMHGDLIVGHGTIASYTPDRR